jgi:hypothetical protein
MPVLPAIIAIGKAAALFVASRAIGFVLGRVFGPEAQEGPRLDDLKIQVSSYGVPIPEVFGAIRIAGNVIWARDLKEIEHEQDGYKTYSYYATFAVLICRGPIQGVQKIWGGADLIYNADPAATGPGTMEGLNLRIYNGTETQEPDPTIESFEGAGLVGANRGNAYGVFLDLPVEPWANSIPNLNWLPYTSGTVEETCSYAGIDNSGNLNCDNFLLAPWSGFVLANAFGTAEIRQIQATERKVELSINHGFAPSQCKRWDVDERGRVYTDYDEGATKYNVQVIDWFTLRRVQKSEWDGGSGDGTPHGSAFVSHNYRYPFLLLLEKSGSDFASTTFKIVNRDELVLDDQNDWGRVVITGGTAFQMAAIDHENGVITAIANDSAGTAGLYVWAESLFLGTRTFTKASPFVDVTANAPNATRIAYDELSSKWVIGGGDDGVVAFYSAAWAFLGTITTTAGTWSNWKNGPQNGVLYLHDRGGTIYRINVATQEYVTFQCDCVAGGGLQTGHTYTRIDGFEWSDANEVDNLGFLNGLAASGNIVELSDRSSDADRVYTGEKSLHCTNPVGGSAIGFIGHRYAADGSEDSTDLDYAAMSVRIRIDGSLPGTDDVKLMTIRNVATTIQAYIAITSSGNLAVGTSGSPTDTGTTVLLADTWYRIGWRYAAGVLSVRIDGVAETLLTDVSVNSGGVQSTGFGPAAGDEADFDMNVDDIVVETDAVSANVGWPGDLRVYRMLPEYEGTDDAAGWVATTTIPEGVTNDDNYTNYVLTDTTVDSAQTVTVEDAATSGIAGAIACVQHGAMNARKIAGINSTDTLRTRVGSTVDESDSFISGPQFLDHVKVFQQDFDASADWTTTTIGNIELGITHKSSAETAWSCAVLQVAAGCPSPLELAANGGSVYEPRANAMVCSWSDGMLALTGDRWGMIFFDRDTLLPVELSDIVERICEQVGLDAATELQTTELTDDVDGFSTNGRMTARSALEQLASAYFFDCIDSEGLLKFPKRGGASVVTIPEAHLATHAGGETRPDTIISTRTQEYEPPKEVSIVYADKDANYDSGTQYARRLVTRAEERRAIQLAIAMDADGAAQIAEKWITSLWVNRIERQFTIPNDYAYLEPADVVTLLRDDGIAYVVRFESMRKQDGFFVVNARDEEPAAYESAASGVALPERRQVVTWPGPTYFAIIDTTQIQGVSQDTAGALAAVAGITEDWNGAQIRRAGPGAASYVGWVVGTGDSVLGIATDALADTADPNVWDEGNTVTVDLVDGTDTIPTYTQADVEAGDALLGVLGNEILYWKTATENADGTWTLSGLLRGVLGSEWATGTHAAGDQFTIIDPPKMQYGPIPYNEEGVNRFQGWSNGMPVESALVQTLDLDLNAAKPLAGVHAEGKWQTNGDLAITWFRRSRISGQVDWDGDFTVPLGETTEAYSIDILSGAAAVLRTLTATTPSVTYTAANRAADGYAIKTPIPLRIYQLNGNGTRGFALEATV